MSNKTSVNYLCQNIVYNYLLDNFPKKLAVAFQKATRLDPSPLEDPSMDLARLLEDYRKAQKGANADVPTSKKRKRVEEEHKVDDAWAQRSQNKCFNCDQQGHYSRECPQTSQMVCFVCKESGHMSRQCPQKKCYNCNKTGHVSNECPQQNVRFCFNCQKQGHIIRDCPSKSFNRPGPGPAKKKRTFYNYSGTGANSVPLGVIKKPYI